MFGFGKYNALFLIFAICWNLNHGIYYKQHLQIKKTEDQI